MHDSCHGNPSPDPGGVDGEGEEMEAITLSDAGEDGDGGEGGEDEAEKVCFVVVCGHVFSLTFAPCYDPRPHRHT